MRRHLSLICAVVTFVMSPPAVAEATAGDQINRPRLYGDGIAFDVIRKGENERPAREVQMVTNVLSRSK